MSLSPTRSSSKPSSRPVELFATLALALSTLVAVTVVSIGIARADGLGVRASSATGPAATAQKPTR